MPLTFARCHWVIFSFILLNVVNDGDWTAVLDLGEVCQPPFLSSGLQKLFECLLYLLECSFHIVAAFVCKHGYNKSAQTFFCNFFSIKVHLHMFLNFIF